MDLISITLWYPFLTVFIVYSRKIANTVHKWILKLTVMWFSTWCVFPLQGWFLPLQVEISWDLAWCAAERGRRCCAGRAWTWRCWLTLCGWVLAGARRGTLKLEEPIDTESPLIHYPELGIYADVPARSGLVSVFEHEVLIHLDKAVDHSVRSVPLPIARDSMITVVWLGRHGEWQ
jgi:hypothetical protein